MSQGTLPSSSSTTGERPAVAVGVSVGDDDGGDNPTTFLQPGDDEPEASDSSSVDDMALGVVTYKDLIDLTGEDICRVFFFHKQADGSKALLVCGYSSAACRRHHAVKRSDPNWRGLARWYVGVNVRDGVTDGRATVEEVLLLRRANSAADRVRNEDEDASDVPSAALSIVRSNQGNAGQPDVAVPSPTPPRTAVQFAFNRTPVQQHTSKGRRFDAADDEDNPIISRQSFPFLSDGNSKRLKGMDKEADDDDKNQGEEKAPMEGSNVAVRPPDSDDDEDDDEDYYPLSEEEEHEANEQQQRLEEAVRPPDDKGGNALLPEEDAYVDKQIQERQGREGYIAFTGGEPSQSPTHKNFEELHSKVHEFNDAWDWPKILKIVEGLPHARQKEVYCKDSYEALQGKTRESICGKGEETLANAVVAANKITTYVATTCLKGIIVSKTIDFLAERSQSDSTSTARAKSASTFSNEIASVTASNNAEWAQKLKQLPPPADPRQLLCYKEEMLEKLGDKLIGAISQLKVSHKTSLRKFNKTFQTLIADANVYKSEGGKKSDLDSGIAVFKCALGKFEDALYARREKEENLLVPGPMAGEEHFTQPFLLVVLQALGAAIDKTLIIDSLATTTVQTNSGSPAKTTVQTKRICPKTSERPKRIADKSICADGRFIFLLSDDSVEIPVEVKRGQRSNSKPSSLLVESTNQILSYVAKHVGIGFNFAGVGVDTKATGVVLTPAYVNIIQLQLKNAGTNDIELIKLETGCLPLLSEKNFIKWTGSYANDWIYLKTMLYPPDNTEPEVPKGLVALWNLMTSSRKDLFGPPPWISDCLQDLIGFGACASVYSGKGEFNDCVIKLSRYGVKQALEREITALNALTALQDCPNCIPRLKKSELHKLIVEIGGVPVALPALILQPRAIPVRGYIASLELQDKKDALRAIGTDVANGVFFIHKNGIHHNDVSPKNILVNITGTQHKNATGILIDFGLASLKSETITGFQGTFLFAHRAVFLKYPNTKWEPMRDYDQSSLAFSMAALARWTVRSNEKNILWKSFQPHSDSVDTRNALDEWATNRSNIAWKYLKEAGFPEVGEKDPEIQWKKWCFDI